MKYKKTVASVIGNPWMITPSLISGYLPMLSAFLNNKDVSNLYDKETPVFSVFQDTASGGPATTSASQNNIGIINMTGIIFKDDQMCGPVGTKSMQAQMESWKANKEVDAVLFYTDSPGGQASGTRRFAEYVNNYELPTAAYIDGVAGSAAYYIIAATDQLFMEPNSDVVGSIGAMTTYKNISEGLTKMGIEITEIYAESSYDKNLADRKAKEGDFSLIQEGLDPMAAKFEEDVLSYRDGKLNKAATHGKVYGPEEAVSFGLVDQLGSFNNAISYLQGEIYKKPTNTNHAMNNEYPQIEATLNKKFGEGEASNGILLSEVEANSVEEQIVQLQAAANNEVELKDAAVAAAAAAELKVTEVEASAFAANSMNETLVNSVNESLSLEGEAKATDIASAFAALTNQITLLGEQPGAGHTNLPANAEAEENSQMDFNTPFYNQTKELLK